LNKESVTDGNLYEWPYYLSIGMRATFGCKATKAFDISPS